MISDGTATKIASSAICSRHSKSGRSRETGAEIVRVTATSTNRVIA